MIRFLEKYILFFAAGFVILSWLSVAYAKVTWYDENYFAIAFNGLNTLFSGLTLAFVVWVAVMQRKELKETIRQLEEQGRELKNQTIAAKNQTRLSILPFIEKTVRSRDLIGYMPKTYENSSTKYKYTLELQFSDAVIYNAKCIKFELNDLEMETIGPGNSKSHLFYEGYSKNELIMNESGKLDFRDALGNNYEMKIDIVGVERLPASGLISYKTILHTPTLV